MSVTPNSMVRWKEYNFTKLIDFSMIKFSLETIQLKKCFEENFLLEKKDLCSKLDDWALEKSQLVALLNDSENSKLDNTKTIQELEDKLLLEKSKMEKILTEKESEEMRSNELVSHCNSELERLNKNYGAETEKVSMR